MDEHDEWAKEKVALQKKADDDEKDSLEKAMEKIVVAAVKKSLEEERERIREEMEKEKKKMREEMEEEKKMMWKEIEDVERNRGYGESEGEVGGREDGGGEETGRASREDEGFVEGNES